MEGTAPAQMTVNGRPRPWRAGLTLGELLRELGAEGMGVAAERNGQVVRRADFERTELAPGDRIEVVRLVGGG
jgi:thiamine biosynthesis protein ThiS